MSIGREKGWGHHSVKVLVEVWDCRLSQTSLIPSEILTVYKLHFRLGSFLSGICALRTVINSHPT